LGDLLLLFFFFFFFSLPLVPLRTLLNFPTKRSNIQNREREKERKRKNLSAILLTAAANLQLTGNSPPTITPQGKGIRGEGGRCSNKDKGEKRIKNRRSRSTGSYRSSSRKRRRSRSRNSSSMVRSTQKLRASWSDLLCNRVDFTAYPPNKIPLNIQQSKTATILGWLQIWPTLVGYYWKPSSSLFSFSLSLSLSLCLFVCLYVWLLWGRRGSVGAWGGEGRGGEGLEGEGRVG
jgi:hypothetical protein